MSEGKKKILVGDDDPMMADFLSIFLNTSGFDVVTASDGGGVLNVVKQVKPDLLLLDITLPDMSGFDVCKQLRTDTANASMPIVMLTGKKDESAIVQALTEGADDYVTKPFDNKELLAKVNALLTRAEAKQLPSQQ